MKAIRASFDEAHLPEKEPKSFTFISWSILHFSSIYKSHKRMLGLFFFFFEDSIFIETYA